MPDQLDVKGSCSSVTRGPRDIRDTAPAGIRFADLDDHGFIQTGHSTPLTSGAAAGAETAAETGWRRLMLETSQPGIFAAGDVRSGSARRVATAVGEGTMAIRLAFERARLA